MNSTRLFLLHVAISLLTLHSAVLADGGSIEISDSFVRVPHDIVPRFGNIVGAGKPIMVNLRAGNFSDPTIWPDGMVPGHDARIQIASDTVVTYDLHTETRLDCIEVAEHGHLTFATDRSTKIYLNELLIMPAGELSLGTEDQPIGDGVTAEIVIRGDTALKTGSIAVPGIDPRQYGKGLIVFEKVRIHGRRMDQTFIRFAGEPLAGKTTVELAVLP